jgi:tRNA modification GTPase
MIDKNDTITAIATPSGKGGIGIIRMSGPLALSIVSTIIKRPPSARQADYCSFKDANGSTLDTGIVLYFPAPASYTGEDVVELQGHGGQVVLNSILQRALQLGARLARPGEFTERAFHNDKLDLLQAEAVADLIDSSSNEAARSAMRSLNGEFSARTDVLLKELINTRVYVEGALDFPEEEIDFLRESDVGEKIDKALQVIGKILSEAQQGQVLREGISIAIIGEPNVGKSSLLNALSQTNKAIVSPGPGTTRDIVEEKILINGVLIHVVDTAGIRDTTDSVEQEGINRARIAAEKADLVLLVKEASREAQEQMCSLGGQIPEEKPCIVLYNKIDLLASPARKIESPGKRPEVFLSAKTNEGIDLLKEQIRCVMGLANTGEAVLSGRTRHIEALKNARILLKKAAKKMKSNKPAAELIAEDLLRAQRWIESITGKSTSDDLLGEIFSHFCIGK